MIKKSKAVSPVMWEIFDHFPKVVSKAKGQLGDLLDTINAFMVHGKDTFAQRESSIRTYAQIVEQAMFTKKVISDCEGAICCQLLFQSLTGTQSLNPVMEGLLDLTSRRMNEDPDPIEVKKQLFGVFMSAMYYSAPLTLQYLESKNLTTSLIEQLCNVR